MEMQRAAITNTECWAIFNITAGNFRHAKSSHGVCIQFTEQQCQMMSGNVPTPFAPSLGHCNRIVSMGEKKVNKPSQQ